jgi:hypothetical protein
MYRCDAFLLCKEEEKNEFAVLLLLLLEVENRMNIRRKKGEKRDEWRAKNKKKAGESRPVQGSIIIANTATAHPPVKIRSG